MSLQNSVCVIRLWLNFCFLTVNCLDQHVEKSPDRVALIWERDEPGTAVHVTYRYGTFSSYNAWGCGGAGRRIASLNSDLCETLHSSEVPQHTGHAATACGIVMRYLLKNEVLFQLRNDILPLASSWGLPDLRCLYNKRSTQSEVQCMQISGNYWEFQIQICHHLVLVLIRLACGFPVSKWVVLEQKDFFFFPPWLMSHLPAFFLKFLWQ